MIVRLLFPAETSPLVGTSRESLFLKHRASYLPRLQIETHVHIPYQVSLQTALGISIKAITIAFGGDIFSVVLRRCRPIFELILPVDREPFLVCGVVVIGRSHVTAIGSSAGWSGRRLLLG